MTNPTSTILLTETVKKGGCAAKLPAGELKSLLDSLSLKKPLELEVGTDTMDDAALWDLGDGRYLVQTLDFFTPIVDEAKDFGAIAATNALSDIYAMGGEPKTALSILAFPMAHLPLEILRDLLTGAVAKIEESGACLAGGHSIDDDTLKLGFSVAGFVAKDKAWKNSGAMPGDKLILTKALGTGTIASALKSKKAKPEWIKEAIESMTQLNSAPELLRSFSIHSATDITGFGFASHALNMARASRVGFTIECEKLPTLNGAMTCLTEKILNRAHHTNASYVKDYVQYDSKISEEKRWLTLDPQTSGGLLLSVKEEETNAVLSALKTRFPTSAVIGSVSSYSNGPLVAFLP